MEKTSYKIIFCNDSPKFVFPGGTSDAIILEKMDELAQADYARHCLIPASYNEYRKSVYWHIHEVGRPKLYHKVDHLDSPQDLVLLNRSVAWYYIQSDSRKIQGLYVSNNTSFFQSLLIPKLLLGFIRRLPSGEWAWETSAWGHLQKGTEPNAEYARKTLFTTLATSSADSTHLA